MEENQGEALIGVVANVALEHSVSSYLIGVGMVLKAVVTAARALADDGLDLAQFADLLEGQDVV